MEAQEKSIIKGGRLRYKTSFLESDVMRYGDLRHLECDQVATLLEGKAADSLLIIGTSLTAPKARQPVAGLAREIDRKLGGVVIWVGPRQPTRTVETLTGLDFWVFATADEFSSASLAVVGK